jgi:hypothetical protein
LRKRRSLVQPEGGTVEKLRLSANVEVEADESYDSLHEELWVCLRLDILFLAC